MTWIAPEKEEEILRLLETEMPGRVIARKVGVSAGTVRKMRLAMGVVVLWSEAKKSEVHSFLVGGMSVSAVAARMNVTPGEVEAYVYANRRKAIAGGAYKCGLCNSIVLSPKESCTIRKNNTPPDHINKENVSSLYGTAMEVLQLNDMAVIPHPLFYHLALKAGRIIKKINDKKEKT